MGQIFLARIFSFPYPVAPYIVLSKVTPIDFIIATMQRV